MTKTKVRVKGNKLIATSDSPEGANHAIWEAAARFPNEIRITGPLVVEKDNTGTYSRTFEPVGKPITPPSTGRFHPDSV
jgi:hypothetical protein